MKARTGYIPEKLVYICKPESEHITKWEDSDEIITKQLVHRAFVTDPSNKKTVETGKSWVGSRNWVQDNTKPNNGYYQELTPELFESDNAPISDVKIIGYSHRSEGGGAYQAIIKDKFLVDFRDDVMLDTIQRASIENGLIKDYFIWARVGSEMKLVRVGSWLHQEMIRATEIDEAKPIDYLELGGIYSNKKGEKYVYLGRFDITTFDETKENTGHYTTHAGYFKIIKKNHLVFLRLYDFYDYEGKHKDKNPFNGESYFPSLYYVKSHSFKTKVGNLIVPPDWIQKGEKQVLAKLEANKGRGRPNDMSLEAHYSPILALAKNPVLDKIKVVN